MLYRRFQSYQLLAEKPKTRVLFSVPNSGHMFCCVHVPPIVFLQNPHLSPAFFKISLPQSCFLRCLSLLLLQAVLTFPLPPWAPPSPRSCGSLPWSSLGPLPPRILYETVLNLILLQHLSGNSRLRTRKCKFLNHFHEV